MEQQKGKNTGFRFEVLGAMGLRSRFSRIFWLEGCGLGLLR